MGMKSMTLTRMQRLERLRREVEENATRVRSMVQRWRQGEDVTEDIEAFRERNAGVEMALQALEAQELVH